MADAESPEPDVVDGVPYCRDACRHHDGKRCRLMGLRPSGICEPAVQALAAELAAARPLLDACASATLYQGVTGTYFMAGEKLVAAAELARRAGQKGSTDG